MTRVFSALCCWLAVATSAHAECAWVLWEQNTHNRWKILRAVRDEPTCHMALRDELEGMKRVMGDGASVVQASPDSAVYHLPISGSTGLQCLPDTVDPRRPR